MIREKSFWPTMPEKLPSDRSLRQAVLIELAHIDLEMRLKRGEPVRVESYFSRFPPLAGDPAVAVELIASEFQFRSRAEPQLGADEFVGRFPQFEGRLRQSWHAARRTWQLRYL